MTDPPPPPTTRPMRRTDLAEVGCVLARAFAHDPFYVALFPDAAARARILPAYFERSAAASLDMGAAWVAELPDRGIAGAALWAPPAEAGADAARSTPAGTLPDLFGADAFEAYAAVMDHLRSHRRTTLASPHWYLNLVGVHPAAHGGGVGRALLHATLERVDREGIATALETFAEANLGLYARFGFEREYAGREPRTGLRWWLLVRPPSSSRSPAQPADVRERNAVSNARASDTE